MVMKTIKVLQLSVCYNTDPVNYNTDPVNNVLFIIEMKFSIHYTTIQCSYLVIQIFQLGLLFILECSLKHGY